MTKFKRTDTKNGRTLYFIDGSMVSAKKIPASVLSVLDSTMEIEVDLPEAEEAPALKETNTDLCLFCEEPSTHLKFVHGLNVGLCDTDYQAKNTGKVAQQMRARQYI